MKNAGCPAISSRQIYSTERVGLIVVQPYSKISFLVDAGIAQRQTASASLQQREKTGIPGSRNVGCGKIFIPPALLKDSFRAMRICRKLCFFSTRFWDISIGPTGSPPVSWRHRAGRRNILFRNPFCILSCPERGGGCVKVFKNGTSEE